MVLVNCRLTTGSEIYYKVSKLPEKSIETFFDVGCGNYVLIYPFV